MCLAGPSPQLTGFFVGSGDVSTLFWFRLGSHCSV